MSDFQIKSQKDLVEELLRQSPYLRDHDGALLASAIINQVGPMRILKMSALDLLKEMEEGTLPHFESVRRCRQKLQEHNPELRGERYLDRTKELEPEVREEMREPWSKVDRNGQGTFFA